MLGILLPSGSLLSAGASGTIARALAKAAGMVVGRLVGGRKGAHTKPDEVGGACDRYC
jgi:hypothetical protein